MPLPHRASGESVFQLRPSAHPYAASPAASHPRRGGLASAIAAAALLVLLTLLAGPGKAGVSASVETASRAPGHVAAAPADSGAPRISVHRQTPAKRPRQASATLEIPDRAPSALAWTGLAGVSGPAPVPPQPRGSVTPSSPNPALDLPPGQAPPLRA